MSSEKYEYKYYQNFVITFDQFYDSQNRNLNQTNFYYSDNNNFLLGQTYVNKIGDLGFTPFESYYDELTQKIYVITQNNTSPLPTNGNLNLFFNLNLNPPKNDPKKIVVKNITSSFTTTQGNSFSLICPNIWKFPIQFLDSVNNTIIYEEYKDQPLNTLSAIVNLQRLSGTNPLETLDNNNEEIIPYVANPSLNFTIVYEYW